MSEMESFWREECEVARGERDEARALLRDTGELLQHFWRDVSMNEYSFEKLEAGIAAIDAELKEDSK